MTIGKNIKKHRKEAKLTQEELASEIGVLGHHITRWETDKVIPSLENIKKLSQTLKVSIDDLVLSKKEKSKLKISDKELIEKLKNIDILSADDKASISSLIEALLLKYK